MPTSPPLADNSYSSRSQSREAEDLAPQRSLEEPEFTEGSSKSAERPQDAPLETVTSKSKGKQRAEPGAVESVVAAQGPQQLSSDLDYLTDDKTPSLEANTRISSRDHDDETDVYWAEDQIARAALRSKLDHSDATEGALAALESAVEPSTTMRKAGKRKRLSSEQPAPSTTKHRRTRSTGSSDLTGQGSRDNTSALANAAASGSSSSSDVQVYDIPDRQHALDGRPGRPSIRISVPNSCRVSFVDGNITVQGGTIVNTDQNGDQNQTRSSVLPSHIQRSARQRTETVDLTNDDDDYSEGSDSDIECVSATLGATRASPVDSTTGPPPSQLSVATSASFLSASQASTASTSTSASTSTAIPSATAGPSISEHEPLSSYTCPICFSTPTNATLTPCGHICCGECLFTAVAAGIRRSNHAPVQTAWRAVRRGRMPGQGGVGRGAGGGGGGGGGWGHVTAGDAARCPVCRAVLKGWDGRGGGVIGLKVKTKTVITV